MVDSLSSSRGANTRGAARLRLEQVVRMLARACYRQLFVDWAWQALFWTLLATCVGVLAYRLDWLGLRDFMAVGVAFALVLSGSAVLVWWRRPRSLQVVIAADVRLKLQQTLSTAWEVALQGGREDLADRLAVQAMRRRIPVGVQYVFPLRVNIWGRLTPALAALLVLGAVVELDRTDLVSPFVEVAAENDPGLIEEGARLLEFARGMRSRSSAAQLPRAYKKSEKLYHLAAGMHRGSVNRSEALDGLSSLAKAVRNDRIQAMQDAMSLEVGARGATVASKASAIGTKLRNLALDELLSELGGQGLGGTSLNRLDSLGRDLERLGFSPRGLLDALKQYQAGNAEPLKELLQQLERMERLLADGNELAQAQERIRRARGNLGDGAVNVGNSTLQSSGPMSPEELGLEGPVDDPITGEPGDGTNLMGDSAAGNDPGNTQVEGVRLDTRELAEGGAAMRPRSELEDVLVLGVQSRILPRVRPVTGSMAQLDRRFERQMEAVLAKEDYPLHRKELVRRYFLALSQGAVPRPDSGQDPSDNRDSPDKEENVNDR